MDTNTTRRGLCQKAGILAAFVALEAAITRRAHAAASIPKKLADYRPQPMNGHECAGCCMFVPDQSGHARCTMIEGAISPHGWCKYWKAGPADTCQ
jgi:hypothetical protein